MTKNLEKLLREVFSVDTEAGYRLRYHITKALACPDYAKEINFAPEAPATLSSLFRWKRTSEGVLYWGYVNGLAHYPSSPVLFVLEHLGIFIKTP